MTKVVWRIQCDIPLGATDPMVTCFVGRTEEDDDGNTVIRQETNDPVLIKLSEIPAYLGKKDHSEIVTMQADAKAERKAEVARMKAAEEERKAEEAKSVEREAMARQ